MFKTYALTNGAPVVCVPHKDTKAATLMVVFKVGSRHEREPINGISHFVEHLLFKGTKRRPNTQIISQELDAIGADYNAWTSKDHTGYYVKAASEHIGVVIDMLSDMVTGAVFDTREIERERGTILEEINMYEDNPMSQIDTYFEEQLFGRHTPLGRHIIGTKEHIKAITQRQIVKYWKQHYTARNMVIAVSGSYDMRYVKNELEKKFGAIARGARNRAGRLARPRAGAYTGYYKDTNQGHLILGFPGVSYTSADRHAARLLAVALGGNMSSRLFIQVRERLGLCYFIRAGVDSYEDAGTFVIQAGLDLKKIHKALATISAQIKDIKENGISAGELKRAKDFISGKLALKYEDSSELASFFAMQALFYKKMQPQEKLLRELRAVELNDVRRVARQLFKKRAAHVVMISPNRRITRFAKNVDF